MGITPAVGAFRWKRTFESLDSLTVVAATSQQPQSIKHHTVTRHYLAAWEDSRRRIAIHDRDTGKTRNYATKNATVIDKFYGFEGHGGYSAEAEAQINRDYEAPAADRLKKLRQTAVIHKSDREPLARFMALHIVRGMDFVDHLDSGLARLTRAKNLRARKQPDFADEFLGFQLTESRLRELLQSRKVQLVLMIRSIDDHAESLLKREWQLYRGSHFLTSDRPVIRAKVKVGDAMRPLYAFAISPSLLLQALPVGMPKPSNAAVVPIAQTLERRWRRILALSGRRWVIGEVTAPPTPAELAPLR